MWKEKGKIYPSVVENEEGRKFYYVDFGYETHGKPSFRLWVSPHCLKEDGKGLYVEITPQGVIQNCKIKITSKGNYVLIPAVGWWVLQTEIPCGYRGEGWISEILHPKEEELTIVRYHYYHSPRGALGVDTGYLISIPPQYDYIKYIWRRSGRTYGNPKEGCEIVFRNGKVVEVDGLCKDEELQKILEGEGE